MAVNVRVKVGFLITCTKQVIIIIIMQTFIRHTLSALEAESESLAAFGQDNE